MPDEEPGVDADVAVERGRGTRRRSTSSTARPARARRAACPRPSPSSGAGSRRRASCERREGEPAVAGHDRRDAVQARRRRGRVPEELRVVVRVRVDEAGRDDQAVGVDDLVRGIVVDRRRRRRRDRRAPRRRPAAPARRCRRRRSRSRISRSSMLASLPVCSAGTSGRRRDVPGARFGRHPVYSRTLRRDGNLLHAHCHELVTMAALAGITCAVARFIGRRRNGASSSSVGAASGASSGADHGRQLVDREPRPRDRRVRGRRSRRCASR